MEMRDQHPRTTNELLADFHDAVDSYLSSCEANGDTPEIAFKGSINIRFKNQ